MEGTDMSKDNNAAADIAVPASAKRWNWGAFLMSWIWGLGNKTFIALLSIIPLVSIVMAFVLGARGSEWAWKNKKWQNEEQFTRVQGLWTVFGLGLFAGYAVALVLLIVALVITFNNVFM
jgi:ABC-type Fe3+ transport system permease subunit